MLSREACGGEWVQNLAEEVRVRVRFRARFRVRVRVRLRVRGWVSLI